MDENEVRHQIQLGSPGASPIHALTAIIVTPEDDFKAILAREYGNWINPLRLRRLADGAPLFFHMLIEGQRYRVKCQMDQAAAGAGQREVRVALMLAPVERLLCTAFGAKDSHEALIHLPEACK